MFKVDFEDNCYSCIMSNMVLTNSIVGLSPYLLKCTHDSSRKAQVKESLVFQIISLSFALLLLFMSFLEMAYIFEQSMYDLDTESGIIYLVNTGIKLFTSIFMLAFIYSNRKSIKITRNSISALEYATFIGRSAFMPKQKIKTIRQKLNRTLLIHMCFAFLLTASEIIWNTSTNVLFGLAVYVWSTCYYYQYEIARLYHILIIELYSDIRKTIEYRLKYGIFKNHDKDQLFSEELLKMLRIRKIFYYSCKEYVKLLSPIALVIMLSQVIVLILIEYNTIIMILDKKDFFKYKIYMITVCAVSVFSFDGCLSTYGCENLSNSGNEMLAYLYRIPIGKLKTDEGQQIFNLMNIISIQKFVMKPSSVITIGFRLFASTHLTAITHLMVAVQMHLMKGEENGGTGFNITL